MINSSAVVCQPGIASSAGVAAYKLREKAVSGVTVIKNAGLTNAHITSIHPLNETKCNFTVPFGDGTPFNVSTTAQEVIFAMGTANQLASGNPAGHYGYGAASDTVGLDLETGKSVRTPQPTPQPTPPSPPPTSPCGCCSSACTSKISTDGGDVVWSFTWQIDEASKMMAVELIGSSSDQPRWIGVGFQPSPTAPSKMVGAKAVVCQPGNNSVAGWDLQGDTVANVVAITNAGLSNSTIEVDDNNNATACNFTMPIASATALGVLHLDHQEVIFAMGVSPGLKSAPNGVNPGHFGGGAGQQSVLMSLRTPPTRPPTQPPSPKACTCCDKSCMKSGNFNDPDLAYSLTWQVDEAAAATSVTIEVTKAAWIGIAKPASIGQFSMQDAYAIVCLPDSGVTEAMLHQPYPGGFHYTNASLARSSVSQFHDPLSKKMSTVCSFTRKWRVPGVPDFAPTGGEYLLAVGKENAFNGHVITAASSGYPQFPGVNWYTGATVAGGGVAPLTKLQEVAWSHGMLMTVAWGWIVPTGILVARFKLGDKGLWYKVHRGGQILGLLLAFVGLAIMISTVHEEKRQHFVVTHAKVGLAVMVAAGLQPLNSLIKRPKPGEGSHVSFNRMVWEMVHKGIGYGSVFVAWFNIFLSFDLSQVVAPNFADNLDILEGVFYCGIALVLVVGVYLQVKGWYTKTAELRAVQTTAYEGF